MFGNSTPVHSRQNGVHPDLERVIERHMTSVWRAPAHEPSQHAFLQWLTRVDVATRPLVLDSGCGTGASTRLLAERHPDSLVLGIDQSLSRLGSEAEEGVQIAEQAWLLRARAETVWSCLQMRNRRVANHYLLYPNPWPKPEHLRRRWHCHPAWPLLLGISETIEVRSNWSVYIDEMATALRLANRHVSLVADFRPDSVLTPFEAKYLASGHSLFQVKAKPG
ncbi:MAG: SAM-dependent methyltransferase [Ahniella sp.]|nr:SAM-dependent methyltransferase [Ahniella sp.]